MQKLHLVGFTTDHRALLLSARRGARSGGFVLEVDDAIAAAVADAAARAAAEVADAAEELGDQPAPRPQSALPVRELQARLRMGRSVEEVAAEAGVDAAWVARFADPVVAEQRRVVAATQTATFTRARLGPSALPLGEAIRRNLAARGLTLTAEELEAGWSARQVTEGRWLVSLAYRSRGRTQRPEWELDVRTGVIEARDRLANELAFVAGAPRPSSVSGPKLPRVPPTQPTDGDRAAARRVAVARKAAEAQLDEAARLASKRNAERARLAEARRPAEPPPPEEPRAPEPKARAAKAGTTKAGRRKAAAKKAATKARAATTPASRKPATRKATTRKATTRTPAGRKAAATKQVVAKKKAAPAVRKGPPRPRHARSAPAGDAVAEALAAVRREVEQELTAFATRRQSAPRPPVPVGVPELAVPTAPPVFRGDVVPAGGSSNGATPAAARPRRTRPLRAR